MHQSDQLSIKNKLNKFESEYKYYQFLQSVEKNKKQYMGMLHAKQSMNKPTYTSSSILTNQKQIITKPSLQFKSQSAKIEIKKSTISQIQKTDPMLHIKQKSSEKIISNKQIYNSKNSLISNHQKIVKADEKIKNQVSLLKYITTKKPCIDLNQSQQEQQLKKYEQIGSNTNKMITKIQENSNITKNFIRSQINSQKKFIKYQQKTQKQRINVLKSNQDRIDQDANSNMTYGYNYDIMQESFHSNNQLINNCSNSKINSYEEKSMNWSQKYFGPFSFKNSRSQIQQKNINSFKKIKSQQQSFNIVKNMKTKPQIKVQKFDMKIKKIQINNQRTLQYYTSKNAKSPSTSTSSQIKNQQQPPKNDTKPKKKSISQYMSMYSQLYKKIQHNKNMASFNWTNIIKTLQSYNYYPTKLYYQPQLNSIQVKNISQNYQKNYKLRPNRKKTIVQVNISEDQIDQQNSNSKNQQEIQNKIKSIKNMEKKPTVHFNIRPKQTRQKPIQKKSYQNLLQYFKLETPQIESLAIYLPDRNISVFVSYNDIKKYQPRVIKNLFESYI